MKAGHRGAFNRYERLGKLLQVAEGRTLHDSVERWQHAGRTIFGQNGRPGEKMLGTRFIEMLMNPMRV